MRLHHWFPFLAWPHLHRDLLRTELPAGVTIGLMLLPQGVAYAALAGMPLVTGIYAALLPALVAVLWGASPRLGVGPTALTSLLIYASLADLAEPQSMHWVTLAAWLSIMAGLTQSLLGALRGGWLVNLVTSPVLNGFTQAAGVLILLTQMTDLVGLRSSWNAVLTTPSLHHFDGWATCFGLGSVFALLLSKRYSPRLPAAIVAIAICGILSAWLGYAERGGDVVGHLPSGIASLQWPALIGWNDFTQLLMPVFVIALVSFLEVASSAQIEHRQAGTRWNENQDLVAQGMAKVVSGFCGSFPVSASFSRSAVALNSGAQSGWATVLAIGIVCIAALWLTPMLYHVPQAALAAVVVASILNLIRPHSLLALFRISSVEGSIAVMTCAITLVTAPQLYWGVLTGILLSLCHFLYQRLHPRILEIGEHSDGSLRSRKIWNLPAIAPQVLGLRLDADWDFASSAAFERYLTETLQMHPDIRHVFIDAQPINRIDATGVECFSRLRQTLQKQEIALHICGLKLPVQAILEKSGHLSSAKMLFLYRTSAQAIQALKALQTH